MRSLSDVVSALACTNCGKQFGKTYGWLSTHDHVVCGDGGLRYAWRPDDILQMLEGVSQRIDDDLADLMRRMRKSL